MSVKLTIEGPEDEVNAAVAAIGHVLDLGQPDRRHWGIPTPTDQVIVDATVPPPDAD